LRQNYVSALIVAPGIRRTLNFYTTNPGNRVKSIITYLTAYANGRQLYENHQIQRIKPTPNNTSSEPKLLRDIIIKINVVCFHQRRYVYPLPEGLSASGGLSNWANNRAVFTIFMMSLGANSIKAEKKSKNADHYCH